MIDLKKNEHIINRRERENYSWELIQDMIDKEVSAAFKLKERPEKK